MVNEVKEYRPGRKHSRFIKRQIEALERRGEYSTAREEVKVPVKAEAAVEPAQKLKKVESKPRKRIGAIKHLKGSVVVGQEAVLEGLQKGGLDTVFLIKDNEYRIGINHGGIELTCLCSMQHMWRSAGSTSARSSSRGSASMLHACELSSDVARCSASSWA